MVRGFGGGPRYEGVQQAQAVRGMLIGAYLSALMWAGFGYAIYAML